MGKDDIPPEALEAGRIAAKKAREKRNKRKPSNVVIFPVLFKSMISKNAEQEIDLSVSNKYSFYQVLENKLPVFTIFGWVIIIITTIIISSTWSLIQKNQATTAKVVDVIQTQQDAPKQYIRSATIVKHAENVYYITPPISNEFQIINKKNPKVDPDILASFEAVAIKKLSFTDTRSALQGVSQLKKILGRERKKYKTKYMLLEDGKKSIIHNGTVTWFDARENNPRRSEYRMYYANNPVTSKITAGDILVIAKQNTNSLLLIFSKKENNTSYELLDTFGISNEGDRPGANLIYNHMSVKQQILSQLE